MRIVFLSPVAKRLIVAFLAVVWFICITICFLAASAAHLDHTTIGAGLMKMFNRFALALPGFGNLSDVFAVLSPLVTIFAIVAFMAPMGLTVLSTVLVRRVHKPKPTESIDLPLPIHVQERAGT